MEDLDVNNYLLKENLFELFKAQLKKDFEGSVINAEFTDNIPSRFEELKETVMQVLRLISKNGSSLPGLLYRIDISEIQLQKYQKQNPVMEFEEVLAELIIKRILQKVILKKTFSK